MAEKKTKYISNTKSGTEPKLLSMFIIVHEEISFTQNLEKNGKDLRSLVLCLTGKFQNVPFLLSPFNHYKGERQKHLLEW